MSDRIAVMSQGKVLQIGPAVEIYERPTTPFRGRLHRGIQFPGGPRQEPEGRSGDRNDPGVGGRPRRPVHGDGRGRRRRRRIASARRRSAWRTARNRSRTAWKALSAPAPTSVQTRTSTWMCVDSASRSGSRTGPRGWIRAHAYPRGRQGLDHASDREHAGPEEGLSMSRPHRSAHPHGATVSRIIMEAAHGREQVLDRGPAKRAACSGKTSREPRVPGHWR